MLKSNLTKKAYKLNTNFSRNIRYSETLLLGGLVVSTLLFPKAGINTNGIPITVNLVIIVIVIAASIFRFFQQISLASLVIISILIPWFFLASAR